MQFKALAVLSFATASLAAATGALEARGNSPPGNQCTTGSLQCCNSTGQATDGPISTLLGLLGINVAGITGLVGLTCSGITGVGASGTDCNAQPVCCTNNSFNGLIALGCTPININL